MIEFDLPESLPELPGPPPEPIDPAIRIADETAVEALKNDFIGQQQQLLFTGDDALFRLEGDAALAGGTAAVARLAEMRDGLLERAANPAQHTMLEDALDRHLALAGEDIRRHVGHQQLAWQRNVARERLDLLRQQVALDHTDPALLEGYARAGENAALDQARIDGLPADSDEARQLATEARSSLYRSAIEGALAAGDHATAATLHEHASDRLASADARSLEPELRLSRELQTARAWLAELAPPRSPEPAAFFDAPRLLAEADAAHEAATAQNEADWSGNPTQFATNQHLIDVHFGKQKRGIEQTRARLDATVQDWLARPGADGQPPTERPPFAVWKQLGPEQQQAVDIILAQHARRPEISQMPEPAPARGVAPNMEPVPGGPESRTAATEAIGRVVRLPDGSTIPDKKSPTGSVMAPVDDLGGVAAAGRQTAREAISMGLSPTTLAGAAPFLYMSLGVYLGHAGIFDYQRTGNMITGYNQLPHFRNVSNVNVGLFGQQAGLSLHQILTISGKFAGFFSSNAKPNEPYGLDPQTREYIEIGYWIGASGVFGKAVTHPYAPW